MTGVDGSPAGIRSSDTATRLGADLTKRASCSRFGAAKAIKAAGKKLAEERKAFEAESRKRAAVSRIEQAKVALLEALKTYGEAAGIDAATFLFDLAEVVEQAV